MLEQWILPVYGISGDICGQSFIVGPYIITSAHVLEEDKEVFVDIPNHSKNAQRIFFKKENAFALANNSLRNDNIEDCAVFQLPKETDSPLRFTDVSYADEPLYCYYVDNVQTATNFTGVFSQLNSKMLKYSTAKFDRKLNDKLFVGNVDPMLRKGHSGCPIVTENYEVIGMLVGGFGETSCNSICGFQSATFIKNLINHE